MNRDQKTAQKQLPPVCIPLDFERAVAGLLQVDPKSPVPENAAKKKARKKP